MFYRFFLFILISVFFSGCVHHDVTSIKPQLISPTRALPAFNQIVVGANIDVKLHTGYKQPKLNLTGDSRDIAQALVMVDNNTLFIKFAPGFPKFGPVKADIRARNLSSFSYHGKGNISGYHINSSSLDLLLTTPGQVALAGNIRLNYLEVNGPANVTISGVRSSNLQLIMRGNPSVRLAGDIHMSAINVDGAGRLAIRWLKGDHVTIRARGHSIIQLAGQVVKLDVELCDQAFFNGRYLQAYDLFVKTHGKSVAEVNATGKQHSFATDASDIQFFHLPEMRADLMAIDGAVLDMRDWNKYLLQHYTRYNKYYTSNS